MPTLEIDDLVDSWTPSQKRAVLQALVRDLLPEVTPTAEQQAADADELAIRFKSRNETVDIDDLLSDEKESASTQGP